MPHCLNRYRIKAEGGVVTLNVTDWRSKITVHHIQSAKHLLSEIEAAEWLAERATARRIATEEGPDGGEYFSEVCRYCGRRLSLIVGPRSSLGVCAACQDAEEWSKA